MDKASDNANDLLEQLANNDQNFNQVLIIIFSIGEPISDPFSKITKITCLSCEKLNNIVVSFIIRLLPIA